MDTKGSFLYGFLLLLLIQLQSSRANPIYSLSPAKELASMEVRTLLSFCKVKLLGCLAGHAVVLCLPFAWLDCNNHISQHMPGDKASALQRGSKKLCGVISSHVGFT